MSDHAGAPARSEDRERSGEELLDDPAVAHALRSIGRRLPKDPCPRCWHGRVQTNSAHGWCQPCETEHEERIRASRRRSYHRRKGLPSTADTDRHEPTRDDESGGVVVGHEGWRLLPLNEAAEILGVTRRTVERWINEGRLRSLKIGRTRRVPADAIAEIVDRAEEASDA